MKKCGKYLVHNSTNEATETNYSKTVTRGDTVWDPCAGKYRFSIIENLSKNLVAARVAVTFVKSPSIGVDYVRLLLTKNFQKHEHTK
jgi:hypothetical protein